MWGRVGGQGDERVLCRDSVGNMGRRVYVGMSWVTSRDVWGICGNSGRYG